MDVGAISSSHPADVPGIRDRARSNPMKTLVLGKETQRVWVDFVEMQQSKKKKDLHSPKFSTGSLISCFVFFWILDKI